MHQTLEQRKKHDSKIKKAVESMDVLGLVYIGNGHADFNGQHIDLTATEPYKYKIAYSIIKQLK